MSNTSKKFWLRTKLIAASLCVLVGVGASARAADDIKISVSTFGFLYIPGLATQELGFFKDAGLNVNFERIGGAAKALAAVVSGDAQFYIGPPGSAMITRANGADLVIVAALGMQYDGNVVVSGEWAKKAGLTKDSTFEQRLAALKGARIAVTSPGGGTDQLLRYLAKTAKLNPDRDMTIASIADGSSMLAALSRGAIDGFTLSSPTSNMAVRDQNAFMLFHGSAGEIPGLRGYFYTSAIVSEAWANKNQEKIVRVLKAYQRGLDALRDPVQTIRARDILHAKYYPEIDKAFFDELWPNAMKGFATSIVPDAQELQRVVAFNTEFGGSVPSKDVIEKSLNSKFAQQAVAK